MRLKGGFGVYLESKFKYTILFKVLKEAQRIWTQRKAKNLKRIEAWRFHYFEDQRSTSISPSPPLKIAQYSYLVNSRWLNFLIDY